jgi:hypothetical protein
MASLSPRPPTPSVPAALAVSYVVLRVLVVLNWIYGGIVFVILANMFVTPLWQMIALGIPSAAVSDPLIWGMRLVPALGLVGVPLNFIVLSRLLAIVRTVRTGDPFVAENAARLQAIAYAVLGQQLLQFIIGTIARSVTPLRISPFSTAGWLAVVLLFVLARVFAEGTRMRDELEGTV